MVKRVALAVSAGLILASCEMTKAPTVPGFDDLPQFSISDGANEGNPNFYFLPPLVGNPNASGVFDGGKSPVVKICQLTELDGECVTGDWFYESPGIQPNLGEELYQLDWDTEGVTAGAFYRIHVYSNVALLGHADVEFPEDAKGQAKKHGSDPATIVLNDGRTLPIKFRIEAFAELTAVGCDPGDRSSIQDCAVVYATAEGGGEATVYNQGGGFASRVTAPAIGEPFYLTVHLLLNTDLPAPGSGIPQIPYFVDISAVTADGNPVDFEPFGGASLILCQADGDGHDYDQADLRLFRVDDDGEPQLHPADQTFIAPECPGHDDGGLASSLFDRHGHPTGHSTLDLLLDRGRRALAGLFLPRPLLAVHGGLNGTGVPGFSKWGGTVVGMEELLHIDFENETADSPPANPPAGITYTLNTSSGEILVRDEPLDLLNKYLSMEQVAGIGGIDFRVFLDAPLTTGEVMVAWRSQIQVGWVGGVVAARDGVGNVVGSMGFGGSGLVRYKTTTIGSYTFGEWQDYGMLIDLDNRTVTYYVDGAAVHGPVDFYQGSAAASEIGRIGIENGSTSAQTRWIDDIEIHSTAW